jgi:hypothetical protein
MDVRPIFTALVGDVGRPIAAGIDPRVDTLVADATSALETAHRLGVRELGTADKPLYLDITTDADFTGSPAFVADDSLVVGRAPIDEPTRDRLAALGVEVRSNASLLDLPLRAATTHEVGHGVENELVPSLQVMPSKIGAWRTARYDRRVVEESLADVFAGIHLRNWTMDIAGASARDAKLGVDHTVNGSATVDDLNAARTFARGGEDAAFVGERGMLGSSPHHLAGLVTPAFARVQSGEGWGATERLYVDVLGRLAARQYPIDVPAAARETARAAADLLGRTNTTAQDVRRMLMRNGSMGE